MFCIQQLDKIGDEVNFPFLSEEKCIKIDIRNHEEKNLIDLMINCSPSKLKRTKIKLGGHSGRILYATFDNWITLFEDGISTNFLIYIKNNINQFEYFFNVESFDAEKYKNILTIVNDII